MSEERPTRTPSRRTFFKGIVAGSSVIGVGAAAVNFKEAFETHEIAGELRKQQALLEHEAKPANVAADGYRFVPVILAPKDFVVEARHIEAINKIIQTANTKLNEISNLELRFEALKQMALLPETAAELDSAPGELEGKIFKSARDFADSLAKPAAQEHDPRNVIAFYLGAGPATLSQSSHGVLGSAADDPQHIDCAWLAVDVDHLRLNEDRILLHEAFHLLGAGHTNAKRLPGDLMNPEMADGDGSVTLYGHYWRDHLNGWGAKPVSQSPYFKAPDAIDQQVLQIHRANASELGSPASAPTLMYEGDEPRYVYQYEKGAVTFSPSLGAFAITGDFYKTWSDDEHGFPTSAMQRSNGQLRQDFEFASLSRGADGPQLSAGVGR